MMRRLLPLLFLLLAACSGDAVVFAPTPLPPDLSPTTYVHPGGAFSAAVPRHWPLHEINTTVLAAAAFSRPGEADPALTIAVVNLGEAPDDTAFSALMDRYQTQLRPDIDAYHEVGREAMGDGSWRMAGVRSLPDGRAQTVNTFIQHSGARLAVIDVLVPDAPPAQAELQRIVNTIAINPDSPLVAAGADALTASKPSGIGLLHVYGWSTPAGVHFITGEIANYGPTTLHGVPVRAELQTLDGAPLGGAEDVIMGHGIVPGGFAPFSLRFGEGLPRADMRYDVSIGGGGVGERALVQEAEFRTQDDSTFDATGRFIVRGEIEHVGATVALAPRVVVTVFDAAQNVIAAAFADLNVPQIAPGERVPYEIAIPELGGVPVTFSVMVQGLAP